MVSEDRNQATARVRITLDIPLEQPWSGEEKVDQVFAAASRSAQQIVSRALTQKAEGTTAPLFPRGTRVLGEPEVRCVIAERKS